VRGKTGRGEINLVLDWGASHEKRYCFLILGRIALAKIGTIVYKSEKPIERKGQRMKNLFEKFPQQMEDGKEVLYNKKAMTKA